jgi:tRNA G26 N,N-dimethylase Trm1
MKLYIKEGFYNPKGELARRLGVLAFLASSSDEVFEAFAGSGVRTVMYGVFGRARKIWANEGTGGSSASLRRTF